MVFTSVMPNVEPSGIPSVSLRGAAGSSDSPAALAVAAVGVGAPSFKRRSANSYAAPAEGPNSCSLRQVSFDRSKSCMIHRFSPFPRARRDFLDHALTLHANGLVRSLYLPGHATRQLPLEDDQPE